MCMPLGWKLLRENIRLNIISISILNSDIKIPFSLPRVGKRFGTRRKRVADPESIRANCIAVCRSEPCGIFTFIFRGTNKTMRSPWRSCRRVDQREPPYCIRNCVLHFICWRIQFGYFNTNFFSLNWQVYQLKIRERHLIPRSFKATEKLR